MGTPSWGLLGPEELVSHRRRRTLGLGPVVRSFNDRAVPGLGGVWFGRQLFLATLGVAVSEQVRRQGKQVRNIDVANAIEAMACLVAYKENGWESDPRLRGRTKLRDRSDFSFAAVRRPSFYVTQPMRRATVQALPALGLVEADSPRFNSFRLGPAQGNTDERTSIGMKFLDDVCRECRPHRKPVVSALGEWIQGSGKEIATPEMCAALSPIEKLPPSACDFLLGRLAINPRRENARKWVEFVRSHPNREISLTEQPDELDGEHWSDLCAGTRFFGSRAAALDLLNKIEEHIASTTGRSMSAKQAKPMQEELEALRKQSRAFLDSRYAAEPGATSFCEACSDPSDQTVLRNVVERDGRVLRLNGDDVELAPNFRGQNLGTDSAARNTEDEGAEEEAVRHLPFPEHMSPRVSNLYYLNLDLRGQLSKVLK